MPRSRFTPAMVQAMADRFKALSDANRLALLLALRSGELSVTELMDETQLAQANVNCRIMPGVAPDAIRDELQKIAGDKVQVTRLDKNETSFASPLRPDIMKAYTDSIHTMFPNAPISPELYTPM